MRCFIFYLSLLVFVNASVITGNQDKISVMGGSIDVTSNGTTQEVNSGEITFIGENTSPSKPRKVQANDLKDVMNDLQAKDPEKLISILYPPMKHKDVKKIQRFLLSKGIKRENIILSNTQGLVQLKIKHAKLQKIKNIYPAYYKTGEKISEEFAKKNKVPLLKMQKKHVNIYHKKILH